MGLFKVRPRILHLIGQLVRGGAERQLLHVCSLLADRGWSQSVVTFLPGSPWDHVLQEKGIPLLNVAQSKSKPARLLQLLRIIAGERPSIVHSWSHHTNVYASHARRLFGFRFIASLRHNPLFDNSTGQRLTAMRHLEAYARADCVLSNSCVSLGMARAAGLKPRSEALVGNIVMPQAAGNPDLNTRCPRVITVGSLTRLKGHEDLFRALGVLARDGLDFRLSVVGDGPQRKQLSELAVELGLQQRIEFLGELDDLGQHFPKCQLMAQPSWMEGLSNAVLEGMSSGLAVCATAVGATPEYIEDRVSGVLVPPQSPGALASGLRALLLDHELRARLGRAAQAKVSAACQPATVAAQYERCYETLLEQRRRRSRTVTPNRFHKTQVLMYHNILESSVPGIPVAGHQVTVDGFSRQMALVRDKVVNPQEVNDALVRGLPLPKGILITFDDGASGIVRASEILAGLDRKSVV